MRRSVRWILGAAISLAALLLAFRGADLGQMAQAWRAANYAYLPPVVGLILLGLLARAFSWQNVLGPRVPLARAFWAMNEGYLLNNVLPFRLGELARAYLISRRHDLPAAQVLSSVVVERVIDLCMLVVMLAGLLPLVAGLAWAREAAIVSGLLGLAAALGLFLVAANRAPVLRLARWGLARLRWLQAAKWEARVGAFLDGVAGLRDPRRFFFAIAGSVVAWAVTGLASWLMLRAFVPAAPLSAGFFSLVVTGLGIAVPSAPGSLGVWEAATVYALAVFAIPAEQALSFALVLHLLHLSIASAFGALALAREGETLAHLARSAQAMLAPAVERGEA